MDVDWYNSVLMDLDITYHPSHFNSLPGLAEAAGELQRVLDVDESVEGTLCQLFLEHNVQHKYGLVLLHRSDNNDSGTRDGLQDGMHVLRPTERMVWFQYTAVAWDMGRNTPEPALNCSRQGGGIVYPNAFRVIGRHMVPYEFRLWPAGRNAASLTPLSAFMAVSASPAAAVDTAFLFDAAIMLTQLGLDHVLGIRCLDPTVASTTKLEIRMGPAIIQLPLSGAGLAPGQRLIDIMWAFTPGSAANANVVCCALLNRIECGGPSQPSFIWACLSQLGRLARLARYVPFLS